MGFPVYFNKQTGIVFGLLYPIGQNSITKEFLGWEMSFYDSEKGRKRGISYLRSKHLEQYPLYQFKLRLEDVLDVSVAVPFIPEDRRRVFNIGDLSRPSRGKE